MRRSDDDTHSVGELTVLPLHVEGVDVHRGPYIVSPEAQKQLKNLLIRLDADGFLTEMQPHPLVELLLVVDEHASVFNRRIIGVKISVRQHRIVPALNRNIGKIIPRRHTEPSAELVYSVNHSPSVLTFDIEHAVLHAVRIRLLVSKLRLTDDYDRLAPALTGSILCCLTAKAQLDGNFAGKNLPNIACKIARGNFYRLILLTAEYFYRSS